MNKIIQNLIISGNVNLNHLVTLTLQEIKHFLIGIVCFKCFLIIKKIKYIYCKCFGEKNVVFFFSVTHFY